MVTTVLSPDPKQKFFDNNGIPLTGGKLFTYAAGTATKLATYTDSTGNTQNTNPIILNSRGEADVWLDVSLLYKYVLSPSTDTDPPTNPIWTEDNISLLGAALTRSLSQYEVTLSYVGTPGAQAWMGGIVLERPMTFPVNFTGTGYTAGGAVITNPGSSYVINIKKNGTLVGTATIATNGAYTFATSGGVTVPCVVGDNIDFYGPDIAGTAAGFKVTLVALLT